KEATPYHLCALCCFLADSRRSVYSSASTYLLAIRNQAQITNMKGREAMQSKQWGLSVGLCLLLASAVACSFSVSTANISSLKLGTDKTVTKETTNFSATDTIYGVAEVSNAPNKVKVKGTFVIDNVEGEKSGPVPGLDTTVDLPGSGTATFTFTPP